ncbi:MULTISPECIES: hypothetical protein [Catenuloplanes]|uniref:Uncharacterized protein n=1 Tax=Catenuloplanes niger TaxID=587534 RepID=A0AAE3ZWY3_9ACTN|nr:hypothetical protein [Catenuloplanes niger]MDR7327427.1 hypothetical protein [Catenuloplanes niger]
MPEVPFVTTPRTLGELSALRYRFATARRGDAEAWMRDELLLVSFAGTYGTGSAGNGDAAFMRAVLALARRAFAPAGVVLDLRDVEYHWGDMMASVLNDAVLGGVSPAVVVSGTCRPAMTGLVEAELGEDPAAWLFDGVDDALRAVDTRVHQARAEAERRTREARLRGLRHPDERSAAGNDRE